MTLKDYALDYSKCTGGELYRFLRARCDPAVKVKKGLPKHYYLSRLKAADKNATFRFGDLPAELQDKIYGEVLHLQRSYIHHKQVCYPQILATCKQINVDARDILYGKNDFQVKLEITAPPRWASDRTSLWIVYDQDHHTVVGEQLSKAFTSWRLHLRKVHHLKVIIDASHDYGLGVPTPDSDVKKFLQCANSSLYSLCTFLAGQNQLKKLEPLTLIRAPLELKAIPTSDIERFSECLAKGKIAGECSSFLASRARPLSEEEMKGAVDEMTNILTRLTSQHLNQDILDQLKIQMQATATTMATAAATTISLPTAKTIIERADVLMEMFSESEDDGNGNYWRYGKEELAADMAALRSTMSTPGYVDEDIDKQLSSGCARLERVVDLDGGVVALARNGAKRTMDRLLDAMRRFASLEADA